MTTLLRVVAPRFVAGAVFMDGRCVRAAPILKWMVGLSDTVAVQRVQNLKWQSQFI